MFVLEKLTFFFFFANEQKTANELGVDLSQVKGSGPGGRIVKDDVANFKPGRVGEGSG